MRYQTQASDLALTLLTSTGRYSTGGAGAGAQRVINPATGNYFMDTQTVDIPVTNPFSGGVVTAGTNDPFRNVVASQTNYVNARPGAGANAWTPSQSNALLPNSVAFAQANVAPWTTTPVNPFTSAGLGYSTDIGTNFNGGFTTPVAAWNTAPTANGFQNGLSSAGVFQNAYSRPGTLGVPPQLGSPPAPQFGVPQFAGAPFAGTQFAAPFAGTQFAPAPQFQFAGTQFASAPQFQFAGTQFASAPQFAPARFPSSPVPVGQYRPF
jgi:hypothetical protein